MANNAKKYNYVMAWSLNIRWDIGYHILHLSYEYQKNLWNLRVRVVTSTTHYYTKMRFSPKEWIFSTRPSWITEVTKPRSALSIQENKINFEYQWGLLNKARPSNIYHYWGLFKNYKYVICELLLPIFSFRGPFLYKQTRPSNVKNIVGIPNHLNS